MSKKVYVGNLPFKWGFKELKENLEKYGEISEALVVADRYNGRSKGFGFVTFTNDADANKAIAEANEKEVEGRVLKVREATPKSDSPREEKKD